MTKFKVEFSVDNAAFDGEARDRETARILQRIARLVPEGPILDSNGSSIGSFGFYKSARS